MIMSDAMSDIIAKRDGQTDISALSILIIITYPRQNIHLKYDPVRDGKVQKSRINFSRLFIC